MREVVYSFAMSLDGYIARPDGAFDFLDAFPADADYDFDAFLDSLSGIVMGRGTYDVVRRDGRWDYGRWPVCVATRRAVEDLPDNAVADAGDVASLLDRLRARGADGRIWVLGGGDVVRQLLDADLLDTIEIGVIPIILGSGIPAFGGAGADRWLALDFARPLANGAVHMRYRARRGQS